MAIQPSIKPEPQPNIEPNAQPDARRRADEYNREYISTEGGHVTTAKDASPTTATLEQLLDMLGKSANAMHHAAENIENRGLKLLLKVMAQERVYMLDELRRTSEQAGSLDDAKSATSSTSLQQGLEDIQTSMVVQRQGRENLSLTKLLSEEEALLATYAAVLEGNVPNALKQPLEKQRGQITQFHARLRRVADGGEPIVARVFDTRIEGESAVMRLQTSGLTAEQIDAAPISRLERPIRSSDATPPSRSAATVAGAVSGGLVGGLIGLALAAFVWLAPNLVGWVTVGPWTLLIASLLFGAAFGSVFGLLIGQSRREDDLAVTADGLINGEILVAAYPAASQVPMVEEILQVHHARELGR